MNDMDTTRAVRAVTTNDCHLCLYPIVLGQMQVTNNKPWPERLFAHEKCAKRFGMNIGGIHT